MALQPSTYALNQTTHYVGDLASALSASYVDRASNAPTGAQVWTLTTSGATNDATETVTYSITEADGRITTGTFLFTCDPSATQAELAIGLAAAWNADAFLNSLGLAAVSGSTNVTFTMYSQATNVTLTESSSNFSVASTGGPDVALIPFGRLVYEPAAKVAREIDSTNLSARTYTLTPAAVNDALYTVTVDIPGIGSYEGQTIADSSATVAEIVDAMVADLNGHLPANTVLAANSSDTLLLTAEVDGLYFTVGTGGNAAAGVWTIATGTAKTINDFTGIALRPQGGITTITSGVAGYGALDELEVLRQGRAVMETDVSISDSSAQLFYHVSGSSKGKLSTTRASTNVPVPRLRCVENVSSSLAIFAVEAV